ncbi:MAG: histidine kinase [Gammaproteobacteria bacterium]|nr:MAG: histidine kinase [Gammaproteobacteria bacterium]
MFNKTSKAVRLAALGTLTAGAMGVAPVAVAEVEVDASVTIANMYLWRGQDLGDGNAAISGDIVIGSGGFYGGIWGSSGDAELGTEYDLYVGYGGEVGDFSYDLSVWNYIYPSLPDETDNNSDNFGGLSEIVLTLGYGPVAFSYYDNIAGAQGYEYYTLDAVAGNFSATLGYADPEEADGQGYDDNYVHLDLGYAYNDHLSFVLSQVVDSDEEADIDTDLKFVVSYLLPLE